MTDRRLNKLIRTLTAFASWQELQMHQALNPRSALSLNGGGQRAVLARELRQRGALVWRE